jgi:hypothetical protein
VHTATRRFPAEFAKIWGILARLIRRLSELEQQCDTSSRLQSTSRQYIMKNYVDQFCEDIHTNLSAIGATFTRLQTLIADKAKSTEQEIRKYFVETEEGIEQTRAKRAAALLELKKWSDEESSEAIEKVAQWKAKRETSRLHARADRCERSAAAAIAVAAAAMDEAERAVLRALLARKETISIQAQQVGSS